MVKSLIVGMGEIGSALHQVLLDKYGFEKVFSYDIKNKEDIIPDKVDYLHICIPYSSKFKDIVTEYIRKAAPDIVINHSTVPVGTTKSIESLRPVLHSPIRGRHPDLTKEVKSFTKFISYDNSCIYEAEAVGKYFMEAGMPIKICPETKSTELMKLLALSRNGVYYAYAKEQQKICAHFGLQYKDIIPGFERTRSEVVVEDRKHPIYFPFDNYVGGHCVTENMEVLLKQIETPLLKESFNICKGTKIWGNCNIYPDAVIGKGCSVGQFTEIDEGVSIGDETRIGAFCFIPAGVTIGKNCFIAPKVAFSNDKHPPSSREHWANTVVKDGAMIGIGSVILPGVTIGENAIIGAGSVVTKDVPDNEVWYGPAAYKHSEKEKVYVDSDSPA